LPPPTPTLFPYTTLFRSDPPRLLLALLELLERVPEVRADLLKRHPAGVELLPQGTQVVLDLPRPLLDLHPLQTVQDEQQVRVERSEEHTSELQSRGHLVC